MSYDAILVMSFGGPRGPDEVLPFMENVVRGRNVPRERLIAVSAHYAHFDGVSPINARTDEQVRGLEAELAANGPELPIYLGNRFWHPMLPETLRRMKADGVTRALAIKTSAFSSYSGCRAYQDDLARALEEVGEGAPAVDVVRPFYNHPGYVETCEGRLAEAIAELGVERPRVLFSAHSIPRAQADGCDYVDQLEELAAMLAARVPIGPHRVVFQSRSGPPQVPWLEPDVNDALREIAAEDPGAAVVVAPFGFVADHMEVVWDLDHEARATAEELGLRMVRARAANDHPRFVRMLGELIRERLDPGAPRAALGDRGPRPEPCRPGCCPSGRPAGPPRGRP